MHINLLWTHMSNCRQANWNECHPDQLESSWMAPSPYLLTVLLLLHKELITEVIFGWRPQEWKIDFSYQLPSSSFNKKRWLLKGLKKKIFKKSFSNHKGKGWSGGSEDLPQICWSLEATRESVLQDGTSLSLAMSKFHISAWCMGK